MKRVNLIFGGAAAVLGLTACSESGSNPESAASAPVQAMRTAIDELMKKPEHDAEKVKLRHILIAFKGTLRDQPVMRNKDQAEELAAAILQKAKAGNDLSEALVKSRSDDKHGMDYTVFAKEPKDATAGFPRAGMMKYFGDVGWRLQVGEVGVAPFHPVFSRYGWHIIKRIE